MATEERGGAGSDRTPSTDSESRRRVGTHLVSANLLIPSDSFVTLQERSERTFTRGHGVIRDGIQQTLTNFSSSKHCVHNVLLILSPHSMHHIHTEHGSDYYQTKSEDWF